ncbi:hypothetical protein GCM10010199_12730 [Dactylosporangium roseum]
MEVTTEPAESTNMRGTAELLIFLGARKHPASVGRPRSGAAPGPRSGPPDDGYSAGGPRAVGERTRSHRQAPARMLAEQRRGYKSHLPTR